MDIDVKRGLYLILIGFIAAIGFLLGIIFAIVVHHGIDFVIVFSNIFGWALFGIMIATLIVLFFLFLDKEIAIGIGYLVVVILLGVAILLVVFNI